MRSQPGTPSFRSTSARNSSASSRQASPPTWAITFIGSESVPRNAVSPTIPSAPIVATSTCVPSRIVETIETTAVSGKCTVRTGAPACGQFLSRRKVNEPHPTRKARAVLRREMGEQAIPRAGRLILVCVRRAAALHSSNHVTTLATTAPRPALGRASEREPGSNLRRGM